MLPGRGQLALILGGWSLMGLFRGLQNYTAMAYTAMPLSWSTALVQGIVEAYVWVALTPVIIGLSIRFRLDSGPRLLSVPIHLVAAVVIGQLHIVMFGWVMEAIRWVPPPVPVGPRILSRLLTYGVLVGLVHGWHAHARLRERERRAFRLDAELAQARMSLLQSQLQPHFLFNAMHAISELVHEDPDRAETLITDLSDLLRMSFEKAGVQQVMLSEELEFVRRYLRIEETRFEDRLTVEVDVPPQLLSAQVPYLSLQPLVENALRHGVARRQGQSRLEIRARRAGESLSLQVRDSGGGSAAGQSANGMGVGLSNTRARLEQMYGERQSLQLHLGDDETCAAITIPYQPAVEV